MKTLIRSQESIYLQIGIVFIHIIKHLNLYWVKFPHLKKGCLVKA